MNNNRKPHCTILLLLCIGLTLACSSPDSGSKSTGSEAVTIAPSFTKGAQFELTVKTQQTVNRSFGDQSITIERNADLGTRMEVLSDKGNERQLRMTYEWTRFKQEHPHAPLDFDSRENQEDIPPLAQGFASIIGESFILIVDKNGRPLRVEGADTLLKNVLEKLRVRSDENSQKIQASVQEHFSEASLLKTFQQTFGFYPGEPVRPGQQWEREVVASENAPLKALNKWTLTSVDNSSATIEMVSSITEPAKENETSALPEDFSFTQEGTMVVDLTTGLPTSSRISHVMSGTFSTGPQPQLPTGMSIPMRVEGTIDVSIKKVT